MTVRNISKSVKVAAAVAVACLAGLGVEWLVPASVGASVRGASTLLEAGELGSQKWHVTAKRSGGQDGAGWRGARRPCIGIQIAELRRAALSLRTNELCYGSPAYLTATAEPLVVNEVLGSSKQGKRKILVAVALPPAARELRLENVLRGRARSFPTTLIAHMQARASRLHRFRFVVFMLSAQECVREFSTIGRSGGVLWRSGELTCEQRNA